MTSTQPTTDYLQGKADALEFMGDPEHSTLTAGYLMGGTTLWQYAKRLGVIMPNAEYQWGWVDGAAVIRYRSESTHNLPWTARKAARLATQSAFDRTDECGEWEE